jgi:hypothetical protein
MRTGMQLPFKLLSIYLHSAMYSRAVDGLCSHEAAFVCVLVRVPESAALLCASEATCA